MRWPWRKRDKPAGSTLTIHWSLIRYVWPHWKPLVVCFITIGFGILLGLAGPWPTKIFIDNVAGDAAPPEVLRTMADALPGGEDESLLLLVVLGSLLIFVVGVGVSMVEQIAGVRLNQRMTYDLAGDVFSHLQRLSPLYHSRQSTGDTIARVTGDPSCVQVFVTAILHTVQSSVTMISIAWLYTGPLGHLYGTATDIVALWGRWGLSRLTQRRKSGTRMGS